MDSLCHFRTSGKESEFPRASSHRLKILPDLTNAGNAVGTVCDPQGGGDTRGETPRLCWTGPQRRGRGHPPWDGDLSSSSHSCWSLGCRGAGRAPLTGSSLGLWRAAGTGWPHKTPLVLQPGWPQTTSPPARRGHPVRRAESAFRPGKEGSAPRPVSGAWRGPRHRTGTGVCLCPERPVVRPDGTPETLRPPMSGAPVSG